MNTFSLDDWALPAEMKSTCEFSAIAIAAKRTENPPKSHI
ncbi:hypothetical protein BDB13_0823 [Rhodococcus sp. OK302]|nr:hypothetical protein BDB13_0823 [Rhodococcus sp. OK302]